MSFFFWQRLRNTKGYVGEDMTGNMSSIWN